MTIELLKILIKNFFLDNKEALSDPSHSEYKSRLTELANQIQLAYEGLTPKDKFTFLVVAIMEISERLPLFKELPTERRKFLIIVTKCSTDTLLDQFEDKIEEHICQRMVTELKEQLETSLTSEIIEQDFDVKASVIQGLIAKCKAKWPLLSRKRIEKLMMRIAFEINHRVVKLCSTPDVLIEMGISEAVSLPVLDRRTVLTFQEALLSEMSGSCRGETIDLRSYSLKHQLDDFIASVAVKVGVGGEIPVWLGCDWDKSRSLPRTKDGREERPNLILHSQWKKLFEDYNEKGCLITTITSRSLVCGEFNIREIQGAKGTKEGLNAVMEGEAFCAGTLKAYAMLYVYDELLKLGIKIRKIILFDDQKIELKVLAKHALEEGVPMVGVQAEQHAANETQTMSFKFARRVYRCLRELDRIIQHTLAEAKRTERMKAAKTCGLSHTLTTKDDDVFEDAAPSTSATSRYSTAGSPRTQAAAASQSSSATAHRVNKTTAPFFASSVGGPSLSAAAATRQSSAATAHRANKTTAPFFTSSVGGPSLSAAAASSSLATDNDGPSSAAASAVSV